MAYPLVSGPLPRGAPRFGGGALLGVGVAGSSAGNAPFPNGPPAGPDGPAPSCDCQQCMLVRSVKSGGVQTLGRRTKKPPAPPSEALPRSATLGHAPRESCDWPLPHGLAISRNTASPRKNAQLFAQSLAALSASSALTSAPADIKPSRSAHRDAQPPDRPVPIATLVTPATAVTTPPSPVPSPSPVVMKPTSDNSLVPLPRRSSLAGLSRPALQRIARAQNRTLLAAG